MSKRRGGDRVRMNEDITAPQVLLIDPQGTKVGIVSRKEAIQAAEEAGLDLVEISPQADPPVTRIMDYRKFIYDQNKKRQKSIKKVKMAQIKEVRFTPRIEEGDLKVKIGNLKRFLQEGNKAKVTIRFRGREVTHPEIAMRLLDRIKTELKEVAVVAQEAKQEGRQLILVFDPKRTS